MGAPSLSCAHLVLFLMGAFALKQQTDYRKRLSLETMLQDLYNDENKAVFDL
jgi:hypothetical protein